MRGQRKVWDLSASAPARGNSGSIGRRTPLALDCRPAILPARRRALCARRHPVGACTAVSRSAGSALCGHGCQRLLRGVLLLALAVQRGRLPSAHVGCTGLSAGLPQGALGLAGPRCPAPAISHRKGRPAKQRQRGMSKNLQRVLNLADLAQQNINALLTFFDTAATRDRGPRAHPVSSHAHRLCARRSTACERPTTSEALDPRATAQSRRLAPVSHVATV